MLRKTTPVLLLGLVLALFLSWGAAAQDDAEARATVLEAFALLREAESYRYTLTVESVNRITHPAGGRFGTRQVYEISGATSGADYHDIVVLTVTPLENEADVRTTTLERAQVGEAFYVRLDEALAAQLGITEGWWLLDDLLDTVGEDSVRAYSAAQFTNLSRPAAIAFDEDKIRYLYDWPDEVVNGIPVHVIEVELDAVAMLIGEFEESGVAALAAYLADPAVLNRSEFDLTYMLWVGTEDGRLYQGVSDMRAYLPFNGFGGEGFPEYDVEMTSNLSFEIVDYGEPVTIDVPAL